jgi:hypothetical protein
MYVRFNRFLTVFTDTESFPGDFHIYSFSSTLL